MHFLALNGYPDQHMKPIVQNIKTASPNGASLNEVSSTINRAERCFIGADVWNLSSIMCRGLPLNLPANESQGKALHCLVLHSLHIIPHSLTYGPCLTLIRRTSRPEELLQFSSQWALGFYHWDLTEQPSLNRRKAKLSFSFQLIISAIALVIFQNKIMIVVL